MSRAPAAKRPGCGAEAAVRHIASTVDTAVRASRRRPTPRVSSEYQEQEEILTDRASKGALKGTFKGGSDALVRRAEVRLHQGNRDPCWRGIGDLRQRFSRGASARGDFRPLL